MKLESWQLWGYVAACVVVPLAWGAVSAWLFARRDRARALERQREQLPPIDYVI